MAPEGPSEKNATGQQARTGSDPEAAVIRGVASTFRFDTRSRQHEQAMVEVVLTGTAGHCFDLEVLE